MATQPGQNGEIVMSSVEREHKQDTGVSAVLCLHSYICVNGFQSKFNSTCVRH